MNEFTKRDIGEEYKHNGGMDDPGIKMDIRPRNRDLPEQGCHGQPYKGKVRVKGYRQDSQTKGLKQKSREDDKEQKQNRQDILPFCDHIWTFDRPPDKGGDGPAQDEESQEIHQKIQDQASSARGKKIYF